MNSSLVLLPLPFALAALAACAEVSAPGLPAVYLEPVTLPAGVMPSAVAYPDSVGTYVVRIVFTNAGADTVRVEHGACAFVVRLYAASAPETPVWQNAPGGSRPCIDILYSHLLPPGEMATVTAGRVEAGPGVPAPPVGASLSTVEFTANGHNVVVPAGSVLVLH